VATRQRLREQVFLQEALAGKLQEFADHIMEQLDQFARLQHEIAALREPPQSVPERVVYLARDPAMAARRRKRAFRERQRRGRIVLKMEVDEFEIAAALVRSGHLTEPEATNRAALEQGVAIVLRKWSEEWGTRPS
jgi:hypothetical protein